MEKTEPKTVVGHHKRIAPALTIDIASLLRSRGRRIVSDSDFDGVTATLMLASWLRKHRVVPEEVEFCVPWDSKARDGAVVIEFPGRAGRGSVAIDHHDKKLGSVGYVMIDGRRIANVGKVGSVAEAISKLLGEKPRGALGEMLAYANIIDTNPPAKVPELLKAMGLDPKVYHGYRLLISLPAWRDAVRKAIVEGSDLDAVARKLLNTFRDAGAVAEELLPKVAESIVRRSERVVTIPGVGKVVTAKLLYGNRMAKVENMEVDLEQAALRHVQSLLYKRHPDALAVIAYIESPSNRGVSISSKKGIAGMLAEALRDNGLAKSGGGRPAIAGAQGVVFTYEELPDVITPLVKDIVAQRNP